MFWAITYFRNFTFERVSSLFVRYFYNVYKEKNIWVVVSLNVKDNTIFPCLHTNRPSYNLYKSFSNVLIRMRRST